MPSRSEELRAWNRKVFTWSYAIAALLMGFVLFVWNPQYTVEPMVDQSDIRREESAASPTVSIFAELHFGPPAILGTDGVLRTEPPTRVLQTGSVLAFPSECLGEVLLASGDISGSVRLRVDLAGEATVRGIVGTTESACGDRLIATTAGALRYHWLPSDEFPAPVELIQPVTVTDVVEVP